MCDKKKKRRSLTKNDDIPLKIMKETSSTSNDPNSYDSLIQPSIQPCELCDRVSKNRYNSIIHNVHHIIIPLINQTVHQCDICLYYFTSVTDLIKHKGKKHTLAEIVARTDLVKTHFNNPTDVTYESELITIVKKEKRFEKENSILRTLLNKETTKVNDAFDTQFNDIDSDHATIQPVYDNKGLSLKNRLVFEEDIITFDSNKVLTDLTTDCQVQVDLFPPIWGPEYANSVHYDELMKPGVFRCKKCVKMFPTRYEAIIHESQHLFIKNSQLILCDHCNQYILGDYSTLRRHIETSHSKMNHIKNITSEFGGKDKQNGFVYQPLLSRVATLKLCEMCFSFCKSNSLQSYNCIGELCDLGKRYRCEKCGCKFFNIKLVKREIKYRSQPTCIGKHNKGKGFMSNEERLKMIKQRLKKMKRQ